MAGGQVLHVVYDALGLVDSVWTCRDAAETHAGTLGEGSRKESFYANEPRGEVVNLDA